MTLEFGVDRGAVRLALEKENIESHPIWKPMHLQPVFRVEGRKAGNAKEKHQARGVGSGRMGSRLENAGKRSLGMLNKCYFCKGKVIQQHVTLDYRWGNNLVVIKDVPAGVCQQCGEKYLTSDVYKELESLAKSKSHLMGEMTVEILAFEESRAA